jgi:hypothetical protein
MILDRGQMGKKRICIGMFIVEQLDITMGTIFDASIFSILGFVFQIVWLFQ